MRDTRDAPGAEGLFSRGRPCFRSSPRQPGAARRAPAKSAEHAPRGRPSDRGQSFRVRTRWRVAAAIPAPPKTQTPASREIARAARPRPSRVPREKSAVSRKREPSANRGGPSRVPLSPGAFSRRYPARKTGKRAGRTRSAGHGKKRPRRRTQTQQPCRLTRPSCATHGPRALRVGGGVHAALQTQEGKKEEEAALRFADTTKARPGVRARRSMRAAHKPRRTRSGNCDAFRARARPQ